MILRNLHLLCLFYCYGIAAVLSEFQDMTWEIASRNKGLLSDQIMTAEADSDIWCVMWCMNTDDCQGAQYNTISNKCNLYRTCVSSHCETLILSPGSNNYCKEIGSKKKDCKELQDAGIGNSGVYEIYPYLPCQHTSVEAVCDMETDGGGWTVFHKRETGTLDFQKNWEPYKNGFGNASTEYWLGNRHIHTLTRSLQCSLYVRVKDFGDDWKYAKYEVFSISNEADGFRLTFSNYSGTAGNSLDPGFSQNVNLNGQPFSTLDRDNRGSCAQQFRGGWWYNWCQASNLNGLYCGPNVIGQPRCNTWWTLGMTNEGLEETIMMLRC